MRKIAREFHFSSCDFYITTRCNILCKHCFIPKSNYTPREIELEELKSICHILKEKDVLHLNITGGEPLIHQHFNEIYEYFNDEGFFLSITTNLALLSNKIIEVFKNKPPIRIRVSILGFKSETYINSCGFDIFNTVITNIKKLINSNHNISLIFPITLLNFKDSKEIAMFSKNFNLDLIVISDILPPFEGPVKNTSFQLNSNLIDSTISIMREINNDLILAKNDIKSCNSGRTTFSFLPSMGLIPCPFKLVCEKRCS